MMHWLLNLIICVCGIRALDIPIGDNVTLICEHGESNAEEVTWYYDDKFNPGTRQNMVTQLFPFPPECPGTVDGCDRIDLDFSTGNVHVRNLSCWEEQTYTCAVTVVSVTTDRAVRDVTLIEYPVETTPLQVKVGSEEFSTGDCGSNGYEATAAVTDVLVTYAARSKPAWTIKCNDEVLDPADVTCQAAGECGTQFDCTVTEEKVMGVNGGTVTCQVMLGSEPVPGSEVCLSISRFIEVRSCNAVCVAGSVVGVCAVACASAVLVFLYVLQPPYNRGKCSCKCCNESVWFFNMGHKKGCSKEFCETHKQCKKCCRCPEKDLTVSQDI